MLKDIKIEAIVSSLEDYIAWNTERDSNPFFKVRATKGKEILAIVKNEPNNQGYHDDMVETIYNIYQECRRDTTGSMHSNGNLSFEDTFYYIYSVLVNQNKMEQIMYRYVSPIISIYKNEPEKAMKMVLTEIYNSKKFSSNMEKIKELKTVLNYLMKFI